MEKNQITLADLANTPPGEIAARVTADELALIFDEVGALDRAAKAARARAVAVAREKYAAELAAMEGGTGTARVKAGDIHVVLSIGKTVAWDNDQLEFVESEKDEFGKPLWSYYKIERSVPEAVFNTLAPDVRAKVALARTVKPGSLSVKFERKGGE